MAGSSDIDIHSKVSFKCSRMTESSVINNHTKVSFNDKRMTGSSDGRQAGSLLINFITMKWAAFREKIITFMDSKLTNNRLD